MCDGSTGESKIQLHVLVQVIGDSFRIWIDGPGGEELGRGLVVAGLVRADGIIDALPAWELLMESRAVRGAALVKISVSAQRFLIPMPSEPGRGEGRGSAAGK